MQESTLEISLENYKEADWLGWISDTLIYGFAHPETPLYEDPIHDILLFFQEKDLSPENYQNALMSILQTRVQIFKNNRSEESRKIIERLLFALCGSYNGVKNYHTLYEMFFSEEFDNIVLENDVVELKSELLQILSKCHLEDAECDAVLKYAHKLLKEKPDDYLLYSGILRFSHRRYEGLFFITFLDLLRNMTPDKFENPRITTILVDKMEEVAFHRPPMFEQNFNTFIANLIQTKNIPAEFRERLRIAGLKT